MRVPLIREIEDLPRIDLEPLSYESLKQVFEHICLLYDSAYDFLEEDIVIEEIFQSINRQDRGTRLFVKGSVEALDLARFHRDKSIDQVLQ